MPPLRGCRVDLSRIEIDKESEGWEQLRFVTAEQQAGPYDAAQLQQLAAQGYINGQTYVWRPGLPAWRLAKEIPDVNRWFYLA